MFTTDNKGLILLCKIASVALLVIGVLMGWISLAAAFIIFVWFAIGLFLYSWY